MKKVEVKMSKTDNESNKKFEIPIHDDVSFKDIAKYLDVNMQDEIRKQLEGIDEEVEKLGKVCDNLYKKSYEEYKNILDKEREDLDNNVKKYISNLKDNLIDLRYRINFDYKGKYREINSKLNKLIEELKKSTSYSIKLKYKQDELNEDCSFYQKQIDNMKDLNIYLKYKLKLFLGDIQEEEENRNQEQNTYMNNNNQLNDNRINANNNNNSNNNKYKQNEGNNNKSKVIKENITEEINESKNSINDSNKSKSKKDDKNNEDKLYITATKPFNKKRGDPDFDEEEYLNSKFNLEEAQLINYINHENEKMEKLSNIYNTLFLKTKTPYFNHLKDLIEEQKATNTSKSLERNNYNESNISSNNRSIFSSSISNSGPANERKKFYTAEYPGPGYITRKENKEIILNFLENIETKKAIYQLMYGESK